MSLRVEAAGLLSTVQDLGRPGHQHLGIGPGGAMDEVSHRWANLLTGNPPGAPTLEFTLAGPTLLLEDNTLIALCGGDLAPEIDGRPVPLWRPVMVRAGSRLVLSGAQRGARCYLGVGGGLAVPSVLGSASTSLTGGFGGRLLRAGDRLATGPLGTHVCSALQEDFRRTARPFLALGWFAPWFREFDFVRPATLRLVRGPQWDLLEPGARAALAGSTFRVAPSSDRMGLRLLGPGLALERPLEMVSSGVATGTLQLPPDGSPILLMADRQTTGGYPRLGEVATVDLPKAAQLRPGEDLRFRPITLTEAQELYLHRAAFRREMETLLPLRLNP